MDTLTTFSDRPEFERAAALLGRLRIDFEVVSPDPGFAAVGSPALVLDGAARAAFLEGGGAGIVSARPDAPVAIWAGLGNLSEDGA